MKSFGFAPAVTLAGGILFLTIMAVLPATAQTDLIIVKGHPAHATRLLARLKSGAAPQTQSAGLLLSGLDVQIQERISLVPGLVVLDELPPRAVPQALPAPPLDPKARAIRLLQRIAMLKDSGMFEFVEPDYIVKTRLMPSDAAFANGSLWALRNTGQSGGVPGADINATAAWDLTTGSNSVIVAVVDTGIRYTHRDLAAQMWINPGEIAGNGIDDDGDGYVDNVYGINAITGSGNPMDDQGHGTHVAGTIGAAANDGNPHVGVAWNVRLMACKFLDSSGSGKTSDAIKCINFAATHGAKVMNNSWGGGGFSQALQQAIAAARDRGVLFVAAAGNENNNNDSTPSYPATFDLDNIISVAAVDRSDHLASFSNYGRTKVHLAAPGVDIYSCGNGSDTDYKFLSGTSMATPHVTGVAALLLARFPGISLTQLRSQILVGAVPIAALNNKTVTGGRLNAFNSLSAVADGVLEVAVSPAHGSTVLAGATVPVFATVTDLNGVNNATVTATVSGATLPFNNSGVLPDAAAGDAIYSTNLNVPSFTNTVTLNFSVAAPGKTGTNFVIAYNIAVPAVNDNFEKATVLVGSNVVGQGSSANASKQPGEPQHAGDSGGKSLWWVWTAPTSGVVTVNTAGSTFDTTLAVYTGTAVNSLTPVASNDDASGGGTTSLLKFNAVTGTTYYIAVDGFGGASGSVQLGLDLLGVQPPPANDDFVNALVLSGTLFSQTNSNAGATKETGEPDHAGAVGGASIWYAWTAPSSGSVTLNTYGSSFDTVLAVYTGTVVGTLGLVADNDDDPNGGTTSLLAFNASAGTTYHFAVDGFNAASGSIHLALALTAAAPAPANDLFENAFTLSGNSTTGNGSNVGATKSPGEPDHARSQGGRSVWWKWTAGVAGTVVLSTSGSTFDTLLAVYTGTEVEALNFIAENDDENVNLHTSRVVFEVTPGQTCFIAVDGYFDDQGNTASGNVQLTLNFSATPPPPANDNFENRELIVGAAPVATGSTASATIEAGEPVHGFNLGGKSVWWTWTAPLSGVFVATTSGSDFDTLLGVYTGTSVDSLTTVAGNDEDAAAGNHTSRLVFEAVAGTTYQIAVDGFQDGFGTVAFGDVTLRLFPLGGAADLFYTQFEAGEGYHTNTALAGTKGWLSSGSGGNSIESNFIPGMGQQAYLGFSPPDPTDFGLVLWQPLDFTPATNQVVRFSAKMRIVDSSPENANYDLFRWSVYSTNGSRLFSVEFDNIYHQINVILDNGSSPAYTGVNFDNNTVYQLEVLMDYSRNSWSATLDGVLLATSMPISTFGSPKGLADIDAVWSVYGETAGDNYMIFDNYRVETLSPLTAPKFTTQPISQAVNAGGGPVSFIVNATGSAPLVYQWFRNGVPVPNGTNKTLTLSNVPTNFAGGYLAVVTNLVGSDTSLTAVLTVNVVIPAPANDNFANATTLTGATNVVTGLNTGATKEVGEPNHAGKSGGKSVWWKWTAPVTNGFVTVSTLGSDFDTLLAVYVGSSVNNLIPVASNDDGQSRVRGSLLTFNAQANFQYRIAVDGFNGDAGTVRLSVKPATTPILGQVSASPTSGFQLTFTGEPAITYIIQTSTNLTTWVSLTNEFTASGVFQYIDPQATNFTRRFYRAFQEP